MDYTDPFGNNLIPVANQSLQEFILLSTVDFPLSWPIQNLANVIATNNIFNGIGGGNIKLPEISVGARGFAAYLNNKSSSNLTIETSDGDYIFTIPVGGVAEIILANANAATQILGWRYIPMNVGTLTILDPSDVASETIGVNSLGKLYTKQNVIYVDVSTLPDPISTTTIYPIEEMTGNDFYVANLTPCTFQLLAATQDDIGKNVSFKNMTDGVVNVMVPSGMDYYIDLNLSTDISGYITILVSPGETVVMVYGGVLANDGSTYNMYYIISRTNENTSLLLDSTILLPPAPPPSPVVLSVDTTNADVIYFTDVDPSNPANGLYSYFVPYPIPKVYYIAIRSELNNASVLISFQQLDDPDKQVSLNANTGFTVFFVDAAGYVTVSFPIVIVAFATVAETRGGTVNDKAVSPYTLQDYYTWKRASQEQVDVGTDTVHYITPQLLNDSVFIEALRGSIAAWPTATPPAGAMICDGSVIDPDLYPIARVRLGRTNVPDYRGYFLRSNANGSSVDPGRTVGTAQASQNLQHTHTATFSGDPHTHGVTDPEHSHLLRQIVDNTNPNTGTQTLRTGGPADGNDVSESSPTGISLQSATQTGSVAVATSPVTPVGANESRPINITVNYIMYLFN